MSTLIVWICHYGKISRTVWHHGEEGSMKKKQVVDGSKFKDWFQEQFGKRPWAKEEEGKLRDSIKAGKIAEGTLRDCNIYDAQQRSALYAWNARKNAQEDKKK